MSEEEVVPTEITTAPVVDGTEPPVVQEETPASEPVTPPEPGTPEYTEAVEKRIGKVKSQQYKAEARAEILQQELNRINTKPATPEVPAQPASNFAELMPVEANYDDYNQFILDLSSWGARKEHATYQATVTQQTAVQNANKMESDFNTKVSGSKILEDNPDFYDKMRFVSLVPGLHETVLTSEKGPELALHLANNPELMRELNTLSPLVAARKLGAIEEKLSGTVVKKTVSTAPNPVTPVNTDTNATVEDNPKDINDWMKKRNERKLAKITQNVERGKLR